MSSSSSFVFSGEEPELSSSGNFVPFSAHPAPSGPSGPSGPSAPSAPSAPSSPVYSTSGPPQTAQDQVRDMFIGNPGVLQTVLQNVVIYGFPQGFSSEFEVLRNKNTWVPMLRTQQGRRALFQLLTDLVISLSDLIRIVSTNLLYEIDMGGNKKYVTDLSDFERYVSWYVLNDVMNTVRMQVSLSFGQTIRPSVPGGPDLYCDNMGAFDDYIGLILLKVFYVLALSSVLFTYVYDVSSQTREQREFIRRHENFVTTHEVTFFRGAGRVPLITFMTADIAEQYDALGGKHWTALMVDAPNGQLELEVHKFITPRLTGRFMNYFSSDGSSQEWAGQLP